MTFFSLPLASLRLLCYNVNTSLGLNLFFGSVLFEKHQPFGDCTVSERLANTFSAFLSYLSITMMKGSKNEQFNDTTRNKTGLQSR